MNALAARKPLWAVHSSRPPMPHLPRKPGPEWGHHLARLMMNASVTAQAMADNLDVALGTVYSWRRGERWPETYSLPAIRDLLQAGSIDVLLDPRASTRLDSLEDDVETLRQMNARLAELLSQLVQAPPGQPAQDG